ncbi:MAG: threonine synthase [Anaerolineae bacterium]|nr:threonine synthase [Anaerolineae bacterium]MDW8172282.1 threonine synthase [Anaerolineae bacterium]
MTITCGDCGREARALDWRCAACGGVLDVADQPAFDPSAIVSDDFSLWRYRHLFPVERRVTLGEGLTPLVQADFDGPVWLKLDYLNPTGSYKDRGAALMMNHMAAQGVCEVVEDSSGNAGAAVAAYSSALGIRARVFVPAHGSPAKKALIRAFGAELVEVPGDQQAKTDACEQAAQTTPYASHAWSPFFILGQTSAGYEIWEQMGRRAPSAVVVPVGHGMLFLGIARAFRTLMRAGLIDRLPRMIAVQSANSAPIVRGYEAHSQTPPVIETQPTIADGIIVKHPVRGREVLATIRQTGGAALRVDEDAIRAATQAAWDKGFICEPTSATTIAALPQVRALLQDESAAIVCALTGSGLKNVGR